MTGDAVSVITVTYRSEHYVGAALDSARRAALRAGLSIQFVVIDNASGDASVQEVLKRAPEALVIENSDNRGFGVASNQGFAVATGRYWLLLNPDAVIDAEALEILVRFLDEHPAAGAVGARIIGGPQQRSENAGMSPGLRSLAAHYFLLNHLFAAGPWRGFYLRHLEAAEPVRVDWCGAAALLVRPESIRAVGGFDPTLFLYGEDVDLGARMNAAGWRVWFHPVATARHAMGASQEGPSVRWVDGTLDVVERRSNRATRRIAATIMWMGLISRALSSSFQAGTPEGRRHTRTLYASAVRAFRHAVAR